MIRGLTLTASFLLAGALPAFAQAHSPPHPKAYPHGPGHARPDSAQHAALHALFHGNWKGTFAPAQGQSSGLDLRIGYDSLHNLTLRLSAERSLRVGAASSPLVDGARLSWIQELSGRSCQATAILTPATTTDAETLAGKLACEDGVSSFTLRKQSQ